MKEVFEEYGGVVVIAIMGMTVNGGLIKTMMHISGSGILPYQARHRPPDPHFPCIGDRPSLYIKSKD